MDINPIVVFYAALLCVRRMVARSSLEASLVQIHDALQVVRVPHSTLKLLHGGLNEVKF